MDDMLVMSKEARNHITDLEESFFNLRNYQLKLNLGKFVFEVRAPTNVIEVQRSIGRIAALSRFISKAVEKSLPFFKVLRKAKNFEWDTTCQQAFDELKKISVPSSFERMRENKCQSIMSVKYSTEQKDTSLLSRKWLSH
ncbi:UNVERIFIED_CONTAM: hypothetical protein Slati_4429400 [Sesamum latifolium]|uniref:Uncharacterized protein n=1 Tax=Sesamum latifolium TaxID=2727402 RepID=A0AAW2SQX2_9LAMI